MAFKFMSIKTEIVPEENLYRSSDLPLSATLNLFVPLWSIDKPDGHGRAYFVFKRTAGLDALIEGFWDGSLRVSPQAYFASLKAIKARLYNE